MVKMNKEEFVNALNKLNVEFNDDILNKLNVYYELLITWNKKFNLTTILEKEQVYLKHFYDSITIVKVCDLNQIKTIIDIGSGAGFPGIVLKIFYPHIKLDILDSNNKKLLFIKEVVDILDLKDVDLIHDRAENFAINNLDKYDLVVSRAVANLNTLTELCLPLVKINGHFIALKGAANEELKTISKELEILNGKIKTIEEFDLPIENSKRTLIKIKKESRTPKGYPRTFDKIKKKPV